METWMVWTIAIPLIVMGASVFLLAIFVALKIHKAFYILDDISDKLQALNPLCRIIYRFGDAADEKLEEYLERKHSSRGLDLAQWILNGVSIIKGFRRK
ncbi:MAG: hypothetical protein H7A36_01600 [Chlamydiales bacterium]|nr:hypothetical protein [Chlamydiales bacterium]